MQIWGKAKKFLNDSFSLTGIKKGQRFFLGIGLFAFIYLLLLFSIIPLGVSVEMGMPSPQRIFAHREVIDTFSTNKLREEAAVAVPEVFDHVPTILEEGKGVISRFFQEIKRVKSLENGENEEKIALLKETLALKLPEATIPALLNQSGEALGELQDSLESILEGIMSKGIKQEGLQTALHQVFQEINLLHFSPEIKQGMERLLAPLIQPNMFYNAEATEANRETARQAVEPVRILKKSLIVQEGEKITEKHMAQLEALGVLGPRIHRGGYAGLFLILVIVFIIVALYLYLFNKDIYDSFTYLSLLGLIVLITLVFGLAARFFSGYLMPVAMGGILITVLFEPRLAVLVNIILALLLGFVIDGEFHFIIVSLLSGLVAIYSVSCLQRRSDLTRAGLYVAGVNIATIIALLLLTRSFQLDYDFLREFSIAVLAGFGNGLFSAVMAIGLLPYLESAFGLTTAITLLELADPGRPLLRKLLMETPGTYHHSIVVGNLAEAAAEAVRADPLLSRVAAFYHDIGKTRRSYFFVENQFTSDNPHNKISPNLSALIIRSHVKDGVDLARKERLPLPIIEIIQQHHGTSLISFFYRQAMDNGKGIAVPEEEFRYEGPLPQTKEAAIILLADAVEAAVRSLSRPVAGRVEGMVRRIIKEKLNDGQLDEAPLTLKDLDKIGDTFVHILSGVFHQRIEYPERELRADLERGNKNASDGK
ncbi:MAG: HDIG domain-containing protein [Dethiobacter sp.]|jgi:putative nucleotidyltransferase with HDIG domain|nr:MAG: HDIG domain-containing protein [Dethiobacter sp.]